ncbi:MAG TPA: trypsin-like peptidase domain-containing protein, partial [Polyangiaceae bacterium]|nr:trypsin-like peptidase domain-containing protein [Polyangiaceae bacterium]
MRTAALTQLPPRRPALLLAFVLSAAGCARPAAPAHGNAAATAEGQQAAASPQVLPTPGLAKVGGTAVIADVVQRVLPSVVSISSTRVRRLPQNADPFHRFFGPDGPPGEFRQQGLGSGVVVADDIIVTNHHVVADADEIKVTTSDNRDLEAKLVGSDKKSDLAVLRVAGGKLKPLSFG